jgi:hypothetical protein
LPLPFQRPQAVYYIALFAQDLKPRIGLSKNPISGLELAQLLIGRRTCQGLRLLPAVQQATNSALIPRRYHAQASGTLMRKSLALILLPLLLIVYAAQTTPTATEGIQPPY